MFVEISHRGEMLLLRRLASTESLDPTHHTDIWCAAHELRRAPPDGHLPSSCADYRCEVRQTQAASVVIWDALDFFLEPEVPVP